jgi:SAM-dependent methyltransferase
MINVLHRVYNKIVRILNTGIAKQINSATDLEQYQKNDLLKIINIIYKYFRHPKLIDVLDIGCDANEVGYISKYVNKITGINIGSGYLVAANSSSNIDLCVMDGTDLEFPDNYFDFVYSLNLFEHIHNLDKCIDEQIRVLKPSGYCYASWYPIWSGPRGHHIHEDMVDYWEKYMLIEKQGYKNNGNYIKDWSHLLLSKKEMKQALLNTMNSEKLVIQIVNFIYESDELNRLFFDEFQKLINQKQIRIEFIETNKANISTDILTKLKTIYPYNDFTTSSCQILFSKME